MKFNQLTAVGDLDPSSNRAAVSSNPLATAIRFHFAKLMDRGGIEPPTF
jgi:hypothetical protein